MDEVFFTKPMIHWIFYVYCLEILRINAVREEISQHWTQVTGDSQDTPILPHLIQEVSAHNEDTWKHGDPI